MSWTAFHSRGETLHAVVETANTRLDGVLPMQVPGVAQNFTDEIDLVGALLLKWHARLSGNIERALMREPMDLEGAVASAWQATAEQLPGVRLVIDRCTQWPETTAMATAMERAREREWIRLANAAGLASGESARAAAAGRRVDQLAREGLATAQVVEAPTPVETPVATPAETPVIEQPVGDTPSATITDDTSRESFVERIKAVLAA